MNGAPPRKGAPIACIGAGTGLGECFLTAAHDARHGGALSYSCWASEGGHAEFSPRDEIGRDLLDFLKRKYAATHRVSVERVVSGPGISNVYEFLRQHWAYTERCGAGAGAAGGAGLGRSCCGRLAGGHRAGGFLCPDAPPGLLRRHAAASRPPCLSCLTPLRPHHSSPLSPSTP